MAPTRSLAAAALVAVAALAGRAAADLPVHCLRGEVAGRWSFELGRDDNDNTLRCGHRVPDTNLDHFTKEGFNLEVVDKVEITLTEPDLAVDDKGNRGEWTMVYDEGFEVVIAGRKFFAFSKYVPKSPESLHKDDVDDYTSVCDETLVGWFHRVDGSHWGCYHARQLEGGAKDHRGAETKHHYHTDHVVAPTSFLELAAAAERAERASHVPFAADRAFVARHNARADRSWTAGVPEHMEGRPMDEVLRKLGYRPRATVERWDAEAELAEAASDGAAALLELGRGSGVRQRHRRAHHRHRPKAVLNHPDKVAHLPRNFDWRNKGGVNYDSPVRNQGNCGSCFAFATTSAAEARVRIKSNGRDTTLLSTQAVVSCSIYNQGCDGGYPYLVAKHAEDFGLVPEDCMPYSGSDEKCELSSHGSACRDPKNPPTYMASNYSYVGGYYGNCGEAAMMQEIYERGPIPVAFDAPSSLFYYTGGVYTGADPPHEGVSQPHMRRWEKTNHAVVAVGWGETESNEKFWIIKNTWGKQFGENGYFRIKRGVDECGIESMAVTLNIDLPVV